MKNEDKIIQRLKTGGSIRCREILSLLRSLGFVVLDVKKGGHKVFYHPNFPDLMDDFDCGHSDGYEIKSPYKRKILRMLEETESLHAEESGEKND